MTEETQVIVDKQFLIDIVSRGEFIILAYLPNEEVKALLTDRGVAQLDANYVEYERL